MSVYEVQQAFEVCVVVGGGGVCRAAALRGALPTHRPHLPSIHSLPPLKQVSLASDFMWNANSREASASFGYDYVLRQCRLRGRIDTGASPPSLAPPPFSAVA